MQVIKDICGTLEDPSKLELAVCRTYFANRKFLLTNAYFGVIAYSLLSVLCVYIVVSQVRQLREQGFLLQACLLLITSFSVNIAAQSIYLWIYQQIEHDNSAALTRARFIRMTRAAEILEYCIFILLTVVI